MAPQLGRADIDRVIARLRDVPPTTEQQVDRIYRRLLKQTHPDRTGGSGEAFLYLQEVFAGFREEWMTRRAQESLEGSVDRTALLRELGLAEDLGPRQGLLVALYRFQSLGLTNYRVRSRPALRRRNAAVIRTVVAWSYHYDPAFVALLHRFLLHHGNFGVSARHAPLYFMTRRIVLKGMTGLIRYQDNHRRETAEIARDGITYALQISQEHRQDPAFSALRALGEWILTELAKPPERIGLDL